MIELRELKAVFVLVAILGSTIILLPVLDNIIPALPVESYTELYVLGSTHEADEYPYEIIAGENNVVYLNIMNHRGSSSYYQLYLIIRNLNETQSDPMEGTPSELEALYEFPVVLPNEEKWEKRITFLFPEIILNADEAYIPDLIINQKIFTLNKTLSWDEENGISAGLLFELWVLSEQTQQIKYDNRFVEIKLSIRRP